MDVTRDSPRKARIAALGLGTVAGLVFALPVKTGSVACPPAGEGRTYCVLQHAYAPAGVKLAAALLVVWLLCELVFIRLPALRIRWAAGERLVRREDGHGHAAVAADPILAAANWGIVPERKTAWRVVRPQPSRAAAAAVAALEPVAEETLDERVRWPGPIDPPDPSATPVAIPGPVDGVHVLSAAERVTRSTGRHGRHIHILTAEEARGRRLRRGSDPALVVSCWSDASSARALPDAVRDGVSA
jgi:hypothetical protein